MMRDGGPRGLPLPQPDAAASSPCTGGSATEREPVAALERLDADAEPQRRRSRARAPALARQLDGRVLVARASKARRSRCCFRVADGRIAIDTRARRRGRRDAVAARRSRCWRWPGPSAEDASARRGVRIAGDAEVAQRFRDLLQHAQPDFEEELSRVIGDVAAHQVANVARGLLDWGRKAAGSFADNVAEYLQEEGRDVPARVEVEEFLEGVDRLRDDAERLEARLARLESPHARRGDAGTRDRTR